MDRIEFLRQQLGTPRAAGNEVLFECPFCRHHKPKLSVNVESFSWKCWVCDAKGRSILSLLWQIGDKECLQRYKTFFNDRGKQVLAEKTEGFCIELPSEYVALANAADSLRALAYLRRRKIDQRRVLQYKIGFASTGEYRDRVIFPSFALDGTLNFFTGRSVGNDYIKYMNPQTPRGYKNTIVMNEINIDWHKPLYLVEGFIDMIRIGGNTVPLFGSTLSEDSKLFANIVLNNSEVYVCLDADARRKQINIIESLISYGIKAYDVNVQPYKDIGEMSEAQFWDIVAEASPMKPIDILRKRIRL